MTDAYSDPTYGDRIAEIYDERYLAAFAEDTADAVSFLKRLSADGPVLELGVGTGRVALPLAQTGVEVHGIDASEAMVAQLRAKRGGDRISVTIGSFSDFSLETRFNLVYVVFNTFFGLLTQEEQISSFEAVARHLTPDGAFVMQAFVPDVTRFDSHNQRVAAESVGVDQVTLETSTHDPVAQRHRRSVRRDRRREHPAVPGPDPVRVRLRARPRGADRGSPAAGTVGWMAG